MQMGRTQCSLFPGQQTLLHRMALRLLGRSRVAVSGYGLDDWAIEIRSPVEAKGFFL
jgi:hypothetical protein